jgi:hypothetical protein
MVSMNPTSSKYFIRAVSKYLKNLVLFTCLKESMSPQATGMSTVILKSSSDAIGDTFHQFKDESATLDKNDE